MEIKPYPNNAKKHPKKQIEQLARAIEHFGFSPAIELDSDGYIVSGHGRFMAATQILGWKDTRCGSARSDRGEKVIPYIILRDLSPGEIKAKRLADNKLAETDVDMVLAIEELKLMPVEMVELTGYSSDLLITQDEKDDEIPVVPTEPKSKPGDIYYLGSHRVLCGDSTRQEDVSCLMGGILADMVFTDPPYNISYEGGSKKREMIKNDHVDDFYGFLLDVYSNMNAAIKSGASCYITHADSERINFTKAFIDSGFHLSSVIIWVKNNSTFGRQDYFWRHEPMLYGWKEGSAHSWHGDNKQDTIWNIDRPSRSEEHPTMKPIALIEKALVNSSKGDDIILDLFLGSGSTLIACEKTGRTCYGMELDPKYVDVIVSRWCQYTGINKVIKNGEEINWL